MPSKHSKNAGDRGFQTHYEINRIDSFGTIKHRLSVDSQLPFGYCPLSLTPIEEAVVSPSGRVYSREAILDYLLKKTQEIKRLTIEYEKQQETVKKEIMDKHESERSSMLKSFADQQNPVSSIVGTKRSAPYVSEDEVRKIDYLSNLQKTDRRRAVDERETSTKLAELQAICPWLPQFTPEASKASIPPPPKRPISPFSGQPLRTKDLIPINLKRDNSQLDSGSAGVIRFICPVSLDTITNQKVVVLKNTGVYMIESVAQKLAYPSKLCPITSKPFKEHDILELVPAASGFAASGKVEAAKYRPNKN